MKKGVKSQAAIEFLTTYAWAFLGILVAIGALYYFGVFDFAKFLPQECLFSSQFECLDYSFVGNQVRLKLVNNIGEKIMVREIKITDDASNPLSCTTPPTINCEEQPKVIPFEWEKGWDCDYAFANCQGSGFIVGERAEAKINITYYAINTLSQPEHYIIGKAKSVVQAP